MTSSSTPTMTPTTAPASATTSATTGTSTSTSTTTTTTTRTPIVDLITPPFSGHLHPLLGIGRRLAEDGRLRVRVISTESAAARTRASGLEPHVLLAGRDAEVQAIAEPPEAVGSHPLRLDAQFRANLALLGQFRDELRALYAERPPDLAIVDFTLPVAGFIAREAGAVWWTSLPSPCVLETPDGPPAYLGGWRPRTDPVGRLRDGAGRLLVRTFKRGVARLHRRALNDLGLPAPYRADGGEAAYSPDCILALGLRELEFARAWPAAVRFVGPVRYTPPGIAGGSDATPTFVPGRRHVLVSLGTHLRRDKGRMAAATLAAARALPGVEFHFTDGRVGGEPGRIEPGHVETGHTEAGRGEAARPTTANFQRLAFIDYGLVPRYDLVVHHGGTGILSETIAAGLPAIVLPQDYDQFDNAARLEMAGLAVRVGSLDDLPHAIARALAQDAESDAARATRRRYRDLIVNHSPEDLVRTLVLQQLAITPSHP